jgi:tetratricopeptide (TPR) repeat protein
MSFAFVHRLVSRKVSQIYLLGLSISLLFIYPPKSYSQSLSAEEIYMKVSPVVVVIHAYDFNDKLEDQVSGVVLNDKGYLVTNYHILSGNKRIEILHGKEIIPYADIIGIDVEKDILILKIEAQKFPPLKTGNSMALNIGQKVYTIDGTKGFENSISGGIISGLKNYDELRRNFKQISASISPGSSGSVVVDNSGELLGITTLTMKDGQNLNLIIPIEDILKVEIASYNKNDKYKDFELANKAFNAEETGDYKGAVKYYTYYLEKYPDYSRAYYNRGIAKRHLEDYMGAIQDYSKAIELNPNYVDAYINRGTAKYNLGDSTGEIQDYNKAIELNPNYARAYYNRGIAKKHLQDYSGAIQDYNKAIELNPNDADAYNNRGTAKYNLEDSTGEIQDYNKAIELNPNYTRAYYNRGLAKNNLGDNRGAIQDYDKAIELNPNYAGAYYNREIAKLDLGDKDGACLDWSMAAKLGSAKSYDNIKKYCK